MTLYPAPKPEPSGGKRAPTGLKRTRMKSRGPRTKKSGGAAFWRVKNPEYRAWIRSLGCEVEGQEVLARLSVNDIELRYPARLREPRKVTYRHVCWGRVECAHVNDTQAGGAGDVGECVPLCTAAHQALDQRLGAATFARVTRLDLTHVAAGLALAWVERGGVPLRAGTDPT